ncbi:hypothetical protein [aff. Roholtiella sp. LEGE 12411]|nr:hypothetical protein [aff. Roholtiella sp. LEGE 12411]
MKELRTPLTPFFPIPYPLSPIPYLYKSVHESNRITISVSGIL